MGLVLWFLVPWAVLFVGLELASRWISSVRRWYEMVRREMTRDAATGLAIRENPPMGVRIFDLLVDRDRRDLAD